MLTKKELVGLRIKSLRESRRLTQEKLSETMDINAKYLSSIERGKENPTLDMMIKTAEALEVELWEIFDFGHEEPLDRLRTTLDKLLKESDEEKLRMAVKVFRSVIR